MFPVGQSGPGPVGPPALNQVREALDLNFISSTSYLLKIKSTYILKIYRFKIYEFFKSLICYLKNWDYF